MAVSELSMSDHEGVPANVHQPHPGPPPMSKPVPMQQTPHGVTFAPAPPKKKKGLGQRLRRFFGRRKAPHRNRPHRSTSAPNPPSGRAQSYMGPIRAASISALTNGSGHVSSNEPQSYAGLSSQQVPAYQRKYEPQSYAGGPSPTAYHGSYYGQSYVGGTSVSVRDFRQPVNSYAFNREDEADAKMYNTQIDEDLEVSYFDV